VLATPQRRNTDAVLSLLNASGEGLAIQTTITHSRIRTGLRFDPRGNLFLRIYGSSEAGCEACDYALRGRSAVDRSGSAIDHDLGSVAMALLERLQPIMIRRC